MKVIPLMLALTALTAPGGKPIATATLQQCATATIPQTERSVTFAGEMSAIPGSARMEIRVALQERGATETLYHTVIAPGLGSWRASASGVKDYTYIKQVTNLSAPALYRGAVGFRWLNARGRVIKAQELRTASCEQPAPAT
jgi:hypothetical protein